MAEATRTSRRPVHEGQEYEERLRRTLGREPTDTELDYIHDRLVALTEGERKGRGYDGLTAMVVAVDTTHAFDHEISPGDVQRIFSEVEDRARERAAKEAEAHRNKERRILRLRRAGRKIVIGVTGLAILAGIGGVGVAAYLTSQKPALTVLQNQLEDQIAQQERDHEQRIDELEDQFFGPLDSLTEVSAGSDLAPIMRELYTSSYLGSEVPAALNSQEGLIYDQDIGGVRIIARGVQIDGYNHLLIVKQNPVDGGIMSAYTYKAGRSDHPIETIMEHGSASSSIEFYGDEIRVVDYGEESVTRLRDNRILYGGEGANLSIYERDSTQILEDFVELYARGPNAPDVIEVR